jgi:hypothetical protein
LLYRGTRTSAFPLSSLGAVSATFLPVRSTLLREYFPISTGIRKVVADLACVSHFFPRQMKEFSRRNRKVFSRVDTRSLFDFRALSQNLESPRILGRFADDEEIH